MKMNKVFPDFKFLAKQPKKVNANWSINNSIFVLASVDLIQTGFYSISKNCLTIIISQDKNSAYLIEFKTQVSRQSDNEFWNWRSHSVCFWITKKTSHKCQQIL